jgi:hypothetical protein
MPLLPIGIAEDLTFVLDECKISEHGTLELVIQQGGGAVDLFDAFENDESVQEPAKSKFIVYAPNSKDYTTKAPRPATDIAKDLLDMRRAYLTYGMLYGTKKEVSEAYGGFAMFEGLGIAQSDYKTVAISRLVEDDFLLKVYQNLSKKFLAFLKSKKALVEKTKFRHKFWRKSPTKAFPDIPAFYMKDPSVEPMDIPKEASKLSFSKWEQSKGKDDATIPQPDNNNSNTTATNEAPKSLFQAPGTVEASTNGIGTIGDIPSVGSTATGIPGIISDN